MIPEIIAVTNQKGRVGKATISLKLAAGLTTRGRSVLLIDMDRAHIGCLVAGSSRRPGFYR